MRLMGHLASLGHPDHQRPELVPDLEQVGRKVVVAAVRVQRGLAQNCTEQQRADPVHPYSPRQLCKRLGERFGMGIQGPGGLYAALPQLPKARHLGKICHSISLFDGKGGTDDWPYSKTDKTLAELGRFDISNEPPSRTEYKSWL